MSSEKEMDALKEKYKNSDKVKISSEDDLHTFTITENSEIYKIGFFLDDPLIFVSVSEEQPHGLAEVLGVMNHSNLKTPEEALQMAALKVALIDKKPREGVEKRFVEETAHDQFVHLAKKPRIETSNEPKIPTQVNNKRIVKDLQNFLKTYPTSNPNSQYKLEFDESNFRQCTVVVNEMPKGLLQTQLKRANKKLKFEVTFPDDYPFKPPFIRVLEPVLKGGNVHPGGALCLEFLTAEKWAPVWTLELAIIQITTALANVSNILPSIAFIGSLVGQPRNQNSSQWWRLRCKSKQPRKCTTIICKD